MEAIAAVGAVASIAQLIELVGKLSRSIKELNDRLRSFTEDLRRLELSVQVLRSKLQVLELALKDASNEKWLTPDTRRAFEISLVEVQHDINAVTRITRKYDIKAQRQHPFRTKLEFQLNEQKQFAVCMKHLECSSKNLQCIESTIQTQMTALMFRHICVRKIETNEEGSTARPSPAVSQKLITRSSLMDARSLLSQYGFYAWLVSEDNAKEASLVKIRCFGVSLPSWADIAPISLAIKVISGRFQDGWSLQWTFRLQHRVPANSPLMKACSVGNVELINQILRDNRGGINDSSFCRGITPLLVAIHNHHFEAVKYLLERGADSNIADDDQVSPLFTVAGMNPRENLHYDQRPPTWDRWFDAFRLLIQHGAILDETVRGRSLCSLNIEREELPSRTMNLLELLSAKDSLHVDLSDDDGNGWLTLQNAMLHELTAIQSLKILRGSGTELCRVRGDGMTALHLSAQISESSLTTEYLCSVGCDRYVSHRDQWGWTPFYHAVASRTSVEGYASNAPYAKVKFLLQKGADATTRASPNTMGSFVLPEGELSAYEYLQLVRPARYSILLNVLWKHEQELESQEDDVFYDLG